MTATRQLARAHLRADLPTLFLHWGLVAALVISVSTGWRIASTEIGDTPLLRWIDVLLLQGNVMQWHFISATALVALVVGYLAFLWKQQLGGRLKLNWASLRSRDRTTRWQAINRLVYWISLALLFGAAVTGVMLYFIPGLLPSEPMALVHEWLSWGFVGYTAVHVVTQLAQGGIRQLLKIITPRLGYGLGAMSALAAGVAGAAAVYMTDANTLPQLTMASTSSPPVLDGQADKEEWKRAPESVVHTNRGLGLVGGEVTVHVRALHDGEHAYFMFRWADPTRSQKHLPIIKTAQGWKVVQSEYFKEDEKEYYEDKFSVMIARSPVAGSDTIALGSSPLPGKPGGTNGLGLHVTNDGSLADVWHWKGVRSAATHQFDDAYFGPPLEVKAGKNYSGGYEQDPKTGGGYSKNFENQKDSPFVKLKYLPKDLPAQQARMGRFDPNPNVSDMGEFSMKREEVVAWTAELDASIPVGTVIPSVIIDKPFSGDRGDVIVHAQWKDGWWTLEAKRKLNTGSKFDQPIEDGMFMWFAVFDHNQVRHTRHIRPLRISVK